MNKIKGFTLLELMIVVAIIGIMASMAIPTYQEFIIRSQIEEARELAVSVQKSINDYYQLHKRFPADNAAAGTPLPQHLIGNYTTGINIENGAIHVTLGNRINAHVQGKILTIRPAYVAANQNSPISWLCGYAEAVSGMTAQGNNHTTVQSMHLNPVCRSWQPSGK